MMETKMSLDGEAPDAPITVKAAARFLDVSFSLVYAYVERKQIPPLPHDGPLDPLPMVGAGRVASTISCAWRNR